MPGHRTEAAPRSSQRFTTDDVRGATTADPWAFSTWMIEDASGLRWSAGPGRIVLAGVVIPICGGRFDASDCGSGVPPEKRDQYRGWLEVQTGLARQRTWAQVMDRVRAIRARRDAERDTLRN
jgi:hypothetical protein